MSIGVELSDLARVMARYRFAYLLTNSAQGAPHAVAVAVTLQGAELVAREAGRRSRENAAQRPSVALVWPPAEASDYSLIVDGHASVDGDALRIEPSRAVLHRPAPSKPAASVVAGSCGADCVEIDLAKPSSAPP